MQCAYCPESPTPANTRAKEESMVRCALSVSLSLPPSLYDCIAAREGRAAACSVLTSASLCLPVFEEALRVCEFVRLRLDLISSIHGCGSAGVKFEIDSSQNRAIFIFSHNVPNKR